MLCVSISTPHLSLRPCVATRATYGVRLPYAVRLSSPRSATDRTTRGSRRLVRGGVAEAPAARRELVGQRVDHLAVELCFPVHVRPGRDAGHADERDRLPAHDALPDLHQAQRGVVGADLKG